MEKGTRRNLAKLWLRRAVANSAQTQILWLQLRVEAFSTAICGMMPFGRFSFLQVGCVATSGRQAFCQGCPRQDAFIVLS